MQDRNTDSVETATPTPPVGPERFGVEPLDEDGIAGMRITLRYETDEQAIRMLEAVIEQMLPPRRSLLPGENYADYLMSVRWQCVRLRALIRAGRKCQVCSSRERLEVHHNTYERVGHEADTDLIVLCRAHHKRFHEHAS